MKKSGYYFIEAMPKAGHSRPAAGNMEPGSWTPYKLWTGDLWECPDCRHQLVSGTGREPILEHYQDGFAERVKQLGAE